MSTPPPVHRFPYPLLERLPFHGQQAPGPPDLSAFSYPCGVTDKVATAKSHCFFTLWRGDGHLVEVVVYLIVPFEELTV
jgi:hypothetical protein